MVIARFVEGLRQANGWIAGITEMPWARFVMFNAIGAFLWVSAWVTVGYVSGSHLDVVYNEISRYSLYVLVVILAALAVLLVRHRRRRAKHDGLTEG